MVMMLIMGKKVEKGKNDKKSEVALSGLLKFINGLWPASCEGERIIVLTTNLKKKLDLAVIRRGRIDKHIELRCCRFEAFKGLVKKYWGLEEHSKFDSIEYLLVETDVSAFNVAECLMPREARDVDHCLNGLIRVLQQAKIDSKLKLEEEEEAKKKKKAEEEDVEHLLNGLIRVLEQSKIEAKLKLEEEEEEEDEEGKGGRRREEEEEG